MRLPLVKVGCFVTYRHAADAEVLLTGVVTATERRRITNERGRVIAFRSFFTIAGTDELVDHERIVKSQSSADIKAELVADLVGRDVIENLEESKRSVRDWYTENDPRGLLRHE